MSDGPLSLNLRPWERQMLLTACRGRCGICGRAITDESWHVDHVIPRVKGGAHTWENLQPAHATCNIRKGDDDTLPAWIVQRIHAENSAGHSASEIARRLNREGVPTLRGSRWGAACSWHGGTVRRVLERYGALGFEIPPMLTDLRATVPEHPSGRAAPYRPTQPGRLAAGPKYTPRSGGVAAG